MSSASDRNRQQGSRRTNEGAQASRGDAERLPYERPRLQVLGDVRDVTLGASPGTGDSNDPVNFQF